MYLDGLAKPDTSQIKTWSLWALVWVVLFYLYIHYFK
jgi:hypothetical protein